MKKSALILLMIIVTLSSLFAFSACDKDKDTANGKTVTDLLGREVTVPEKINRVVCIGAGSLRLYTYVGDLSKLVGVEDVDRDGTGVGATLSIRPYKMVNKDLFNSLPSCGKGGPQGSPEAEKILALNPDIVFSLYHFGQGGDGRFTAKNRETRRGIKLRQDGSGLTQTSKKSLPFLANF